MFFWLFIYSMCVACISWTVTKTKIFKPIREKLGWEVLKCPYCLSFWVALLFAPIGDGALFWFYSWLSIVWLAAFQYSILALIWKHADF